MQLLPEGKFVNEWIPSIDLCSQSYATMNYSSLASCLSKATMSYQKLLTYDLFQLLSGFKWVFVLEQQLTFIY